jgi:hypothetical protein
VRWRGEKPSTKHTAEVATNLALVAVDYCGSE